MRIVLGVIVGFLAWMFAWFGCELLLSALWPEFRDHQAAFQAAIENDSPFTPNATILLIHVVLASVVSVHSGFAAAMVAGENKRAPLILAIVLLGLGVLKAAMSWAYVPLWYHVLFTAVLVPMTLAGGKLRTIGR